jgi:FkbH-like protein
MRLSAVKYTDLLKKNNEYAKNLPEDVYAITTLSNIVVEQLNYILEYSLRVDGVPAMLSASDYDNIVQDSQKNQHSNAIIIFWELCNIIDGFQYKIELLDTSQLDAIIEKIKSEIDFVLNNLEQTPLVLINKFTSLSFSNLNIRKNYLDKIADQLNQYLEENITVNTQLVDIDKVIALVGVSNSFDMRYYYSSKSLYTIDFFKSYAEFVKPFFMSANGQSKKALIFDCDNTLWGGILGEDGFDNIEMSVETKTGSIFAEIQAMALSLSKQGVLICLCSKNNIDDVNSVINAHPDMQLKEEFIAIKKVNWSDKMTNIKKISKELNIGLDSLVFVDDSSFEINLIKEQLPEVTVLQVPEKLYKYPEILRENLGLFYNLAITEEDSKKIKMYKHQVTRESSKNKFNDIESYLSSLGLKISIFKDDKSIISRMSQMSQKTNQFNLVTKRYTDGDIQNFINDSNSDVYTLSVTDKYGDSGITGLCIILFDNSKKSAEIDTFLMSCRIIGRNIEFAFMDFIIDKLKKKKVLKLKAKYIKTKKNNQVEKFYDKCSFVSIGKNSSVTNYFLNIDDYKVSNKDYIEVVYE